MNKLKMSLLTFFIFACVSVNAQMPHFSREKPHKPTPTPKSQKVILPFKELWIRKPNY